MVVAPRGAAPRRALTPAPPVPLRAGPGAIKPEGKPEPRRGALSPACPGPPHGVVGARRVRTMLARVLSKGGGTGTPQLVGSLPSVCAADLPCTRPSASSPLSVGGGRGRRAPSVPAPRLPVGLPVGLGEGRPAALAYPGGPSSNSRLCQPRLQGRWGSLTHRQISYFFSADGRKFWG